jgi:LysM repeat protein
MRRYLVSLSLVLCSAFSYASPPPSRGARPIALGNGYSAVAGDSYSLYYNPAGLAEVNQKEFVIDYGRSSSQNEFSRTDFNGIYSFPYRFKDEFFPIGVGFYAERAAPGANIIDMTVGSGGSAPVDRWTKGIIKFPVKLGGAFTLRSQKGNDVTTRVGKSSLGLGVTGGAYMPLSRRLQAGFVLKNLFLGDSNPYGPSAQIGIVRQHRDYLHMYADLEYGSGGIWRFHPGLEWLLARGVIRPRLGWGFRDNGGIDSVATGIGFYASPFQIDIAYLIPVKTLNDDMQQFRASLSYRFGRPQFTEIYYDRALEEASQLDQKVLGLTVQEAELKESLSELEQKRRLAREELENMKGRIEALKEQDLLGQKNAQINQLKERVANLELALSGQRQQVRQLTEKKESIRTHVVVSGDTLQSIAKEYYGDANQWKKIYNANSDKIERGLPKVGSKLVIP